MFFERKYLGKDFYVVIILYSQVIGLKTIAKSFLVSSFCSWEREMSSIDEFTCSRVSELQTRNKKIIRKMWKFPLNNFVYCGNQLNAYIITWYRITYKSKLNWKIPPFQCGNRNCWLGFYWKWLNELWAVILPKFYHLELFLHFDIKMVGYWGSWESKPNINIYTIYTLLAFTSPSTTQT